jgi:Domain of unknown function (DUF1998)
MTRPHQEVRPSQFITTYGPGSIIETRSGPVVPKAMDELFQHVRRSPSDFEIVDDRLARAALGGARIARIPSNAELTTPVDQDVYPTLPFPYWSLCIWHGSEQILYPSGEGCPRCLAAGGRRDRVKAGREAIRFVLACIAGHLDEVPWNRVVHGTVTGCTPNFYVWRGGGRALRFVTIACPQCGASENFGRAYARPWRCTGRFPEIGGRSGQADCSHDARIHQRGAANLRLSEIVSALTIVDMPARLHNVLNDARVLATAATMRDLGVLDRDRLIAQLDRQGVPAAALDVIRDADWRLVEDGLNQLSGTGQPRPLKEDEFDKLRSAATQGAPAVPSSHPGSPPLFEVRLTDVRRFYGPAHQVALRVTPVSRLRMVQVQSGYRRVDAEAGLVVPCRFSWAGVDWFPGIELLGEGLFLDMEDYDFIPSGPRADAWLARHHNPDDRQDPAELHPISVWWHTLSHRLIRTLSIDSGYSSAAIRERVYLSPDPERDARGGLLLYTVQPGGDGTLGGLISLADRFDAILRSTLRDIADCSNDPLCAEAPSTGAPGAACYSCLLASETSCEQRNLNLDRLLLIDNLP